MPDEMLATDTTAGPTAGGPAGKVDRSHAGDAAPTTAFKDASGKTVSLADFRGKPVLLNLWATWCAPCVKEMPTLDALAARDADKLTVLAVSQDLEGMKKVEPFFASHGFGTLKPYIDDQAALSIDYQVNLPTTILFDARGREVWRQSGALDWSSDAAAKAIATAR